MCYVSLHLLLCFVNNLTLLTYSASYVFTRSLNTLYNLFCSRTINAAVGKPNLTFGSAFEKSFPIKNAANLSSWSGACRRSPKKMQRRQISTVEEVSGTVPYPWITILYWCGFVFFVFVLLFFCITTGEIAGCYLSLIECRERYTINCDLNALKFTFHFIF